MSDTFISKLEQILQDFSGTSPRDVIDAILDLISSEVIPQKRPGNKQVMDLGNKTYEQTIYSDEDASWNKCVDEQRTRIAPQGNSQDAEARTVGGKEATWQQ